MLLVLSGCRTRTGVGDSGGSSESQSESAESEESESESETGEDVCPDAALVYGAVCFTPFPAPGNGRWPLELDGEPGDELLMLEDDVVAVHKWNGSGFTKLGESPTPESEPNPSLYVAAGEFDDTPGQDLVVVASGEWVTLHHMAEGVPEAVDTTVLTGSANGPRGLAFATAIGPDDNGRWRLVGHYHDAEPDPPTNQDRIGIWEVSGTKLVDQRLDLDTDACELNWCRGGDFNGDGRRDAVCLLDDVCSDGVPTEEQQTYALVLAQGDGSVSVSLHAVGEPTRSPFVGDIDGDGADDLVSGPVYWLGGADGFQPRASALQVPEPPGPFWYTAAVGDLTGNQTAGVVLAGNAAGSDGLILEELVGGVDVFEFSIDPLLLPISYSPPPDLNADGIMDLPLGSGEILVSERQP